MVKVDRTAVRAWVAIFCVGGVLCGCSEARLATHPLNEFRPLAPDMAVVALTADYPIRLLAASAKLAGGPTPCLAAVTEPFGADPGTGPVTQPVAASGIAAPIIKYAPLETRFAVVAPGTYYFTRQRQKAWPEQIAFDIAAGERLYLGRFELYGAGAEAPPAEAAAALAADGFMSARKLRTADYPGQIPSCPNTGFVFDF